MLRRPFLLLTLCASTWSRPVSADALPPDTVVISANRVSTPVSLTGSSVSVLTADDLATQQVETVYNVLRELPGVDVSNTGGPGGTTSLMLRGLDAKYTKVLIDGIDVADPSSTAPYFDFADLLSAGIDRIEIVRGPQSMLYGSDALGGVVNIVTASGRTGSGADVKAEGGSYGTFDGSATLRGVAGPLDYAATIAGLHTDGIVAADARNGNHQLDPYDNVTAMLKLGLPVGDLVDVGTVFRYVEAEHAYPGYSFVTGLPADAPGQLQATRTIYSRAQVRVKLPGLGFENVTGVNITDIERDYLLFDVLQSFFHGRTVTVDDQADWKVRDWLTVIAGGETRAEDYDDDTGLGASQRTDAGYAELDARPLERLALTGGFRTDQVEGGAGATTYRLTGSWQPWSDGPRLHASDGTGFKAPSLYEKFVTSPYVVGDPSLKAEDSAGWDAGLEQVFAPARTTVDVTWFDNDIRNLINGTFDQNFVFHYANVGHSRTYGVEASALAQPLPSLDLKASYTWLRADDLTNGGELLRRPHHVVSATATWRPVESVESFASVTWVGARNDNDFAPGAPPVIRLDPYTLVRFGTTWQAAPWLSVFGRMENALDRSYEEVFGYGTAGRAVYFGVKASL